MKKRKGNILLGSQDPGRKQSLRYIDGKEQPHYPMPAIPYQVQYQVEDNDYWCGLYNESLAETDHEDCFVMLWNARDKPITKR